MGVSYNGDDNGDHVLIWWFIFRNHTYISTYIYMYVYIYMQVIMISYCYIKGVLALGLPHLS